MWVATLHVDQFSSQRKAKTALWELHTSHSHVAMGLQAPLIKLVLLG